MRNNTSSINELEQTIDDLESILHPKPKPVKNISNDLDKTLGELESMLQNNKQSIKKKVQLMKKKIGFIKNITEETPRSTRKLGNPELNEDFFGFQDTNVSYLEF